MGQFPIWSIWPPWIGPSGRAERGDTPGREHEGPRNYFQPAKIFFLSCPSTDNWCWYLVCIYNGVSAWKVRYERWTGLSPVLCMDWWLVPAPDAALCLVHPLVSSPACCWAGLGWAGLGWAGLGQGDAKTNIAAVIFLQPGPRVQVFTMHQTQWQCWWWWSPLLRVTLCWSALSPVQTLDIDCAMHWAGPWPQPGPG